MPRRKKHEVPKGATVPEAPKTTLGASKVRGRKITLAKVSILADIPSDDPDYNPKYDPNVKDDTHAEDEDE